MTTTPPDTVEADGRSEKKIHAHAVAATVSTGVNSATSAAGAYFGADE